MTNALIAAYTAKHPNVKFNIETRPGGTDGDNLVKTRLATGDMDDIFFYNSGSLLQALHPTDTLVDISKEPYIANIQDVFLPTVSQNGQIFGVPTGTIMGGGVLYNKKVFAAVRDQRAQDLGRVRSQQRQAQGRRYRRRSCRPTATPGLPSCSCWPTTTTSRRPTRTSPPTTPPTRSSSPPTRRPWQASAIWRKATRRAGTRRTTRPRNSSRA